MEETGEPEVFVASRLTRGNFLFPAQVEVCPLQVTSTRRGIIRKDVESVVLTQVAAVRIHTGLWFADLIVENSGGTDPIFCHGLHKCDAERIKELLEQYQRQRLKGDPVVPGPKQS